MSPLLKVSLMSLTLVVLGLAAAAPTYAGAVQLASYAQLNPGSTTVTYPGAPLTTFPGVTVSAGGNTVSITDSDNLLQRRDQTTGGWIGNFAPGERLLWTQPGNNNPMTITFANGVTEFALQAQSVSFGAETFTFSVFNGATLLATFTASGGSNANADDTATFLGARATFGDVITRIVINNMSVSTGSFAINEVTFNGSAPTTVIPEPATMLLLGTGLTGVVAARKRRKARKSEAA